MSKYIPNIGDVILDNGVPHVVICIESYEDVGSCSYDRKYLLCSEDYIKNNQGDSKRSDIEKYGRWLIIKGTHFPDIQKVNDIAPYNINKIDAYSINQKVAKTITIFE